MPSIAFVWKTVDPLNGSHLYACLVLQVAESLCMI
jgi:hypothetical protein